MPLHKYSNSDLVRIDLPAEGEWVEVKRKLGRDDERAIARKLLAGQAAGTLAEGLEGADAGALYDAAVFSTLEVAIKRWSFCDENGKPEPVTPSNIRALDDESLECINTRLDELYPKARSEEEQKN